MAQAKGGAMRGLGVTSAKRSALVPDWPAIAEVLPGFDIIARFVIVGLASMAKEVVNKLNAQVSAILQVPEVREQFAKLGITPAPMKPDEFARFVREQITTYQKIVKLADIQPL